MPTLLLLETATAICSIGLSRDGRLLALREAAEGYSHARQITLLIEEVLRESGLTLSDIDALALSSGPGSYTSLRVGAATAKGIGFALNKPLVVADTLQSLALAARRTGDAGDTLYIPLIDARRMEVYTAIFNVGGEALSAPEALVVENDTLAGYREAGTPLVLCGDGAAKCRPVLGDAGIDYRGDVICSAAHLLAPAESRFAAGQFADLAYYEPLYLKPPNVTTPRNRL